MMVRLVLISIFVGVLSLGILCSKKVTNASLYQETPKAEKAQPSGMFKTGKSTPAIPTTPKPSADEALPIFDNIIFGFDSAKIGITGGMTLEAVSVYVKTTGRAVSITGNCDSRGSFTYNDNLGMRRAVAARAVLEAMGVPTSQVSVHTKGKRMLEYSNCKTEDCHAKNRKDVIEVIQ
jgi:outer membrane protein OmpA-like peptidoglycan-associated protein